MQRLERPEIVVEKIESHRNGISGVGFHVVLFSEPKEEQRMMAVVFPVEPGCEGNGSVKHGWNGLVSVFNRTLLARDVIEFGENSWRGDVYEPMLRAAITEWESGSDERFAAMLAARATKA